MLLTPKKRTSETWKKLIFQIQSWSFSLSPLFHPSLDQRQGAHAADRRRDSSCGRWPDLVTCCFWAERCATVFWQHTTEVDVCSRKWRKMGESHEKSLVFIICMESELPTGKNCCSFDRSSHPPMEAGPSRPDRKKINQLPRHYGLVLSVLHILNPGQMIANYSKSI